MADSSESAIVRFALSGPYSSVPRSSTHIPYLYPEWVISRNLALRLRDAGLVWRPTKGDAFQLIAEDADAGTDLDAFIVSDMTIEAHDFPTGTVLGFNGTTEWALDSVDLADALWFPREDQLREALKSTFRTLAAMTDPPGFLVTTVFRGTRREFIGDTADEAYGLALLQQVLASR